MSLFEPELKIEVTIATFHISEKKPVLNDEFNTAAKGLHKIPAESFISFTEILSYPADLEHFSLLISLFIVSAVTG